MDSYCEVSDDELAEEALAAGDPDQAIPTNAVPLRGPTGQPVTDGDLLPGWYMPAPLVSSTRRSHRILAYAFVGSLIAVNLSGLCVTYGHLVLA